MSGKLNRVENPNRLDRRFRLAKRLERHSACLGICNSIYQEDGVDLHFVAADFFRFFDVPDFNYFADRDIGHFQRARRTSMFVDLLEYVERDHLCGSEVLAKSYAQKIKEQVKDLGSNIHALSHRLHSSKLDYLGLVAACEGFCTELSERQNAEITFHSENIPRGLSKETSLCLFRVLQEALQNAVKYSGVRNFQVSLKGTTDEVELIVSDSGAGFDLDEAMSGKGLGLTSMKERMKLIEGQLAIESKFGHGTTIHARVPSNPETIAARTDL